MAMVHKAGFIAEHEQNTSANANVAIKNDVDVLLRQGKRHLAVRQTFDEQLNAVHRLSVHQREFAYNTFM